MVVRRLDNTTSYLAEQTGGKYISQTAFLNCGLGGVALSALEIYSHLFSLDGDPFPQKIAQFDTDLVTGDFVDFRCAINLTPGKIRAMEADPKRFGTQVDTIIENYAELMAPEDIQNGSRTTRVLTQLSFSFHRLQVAKTFRTAIHDLVANNQVKSIVPVLISSTGGGAGSALQSLLIREFQRQSFRQFILEGLPEDILLGPVSIVAEPFALAMRHSITHGNKILGNSQAFWIESEMLERKSLTQNIFHLGFSNPNGVVLRTPEDIAWVLGTVIYEYERNWDEFAARFTDPKASVILQRYPGADIPENLDPDLFRDH